MKKEDMRLVLEIRIDNWFQTFMRCINESSAISGCFAGEFVGMLSLARGLEIITNEEFNFLLDCNRVLRKYSEFKEWC